MKRRGRKLVELVEKEDCVNERKQTKIATNTFESCNDERDCVESPVPRGCEKEIEFLIQENIINSELNSGKSSVSWEEFQELWREYFSTEDPNAPGNFIFGRTSF